MNPLDQVNPVVSTKLVPATYPRLIKFYWALTWRSIVVGIPGLILIMIAVKVFNLTPEPGMPPEQVREQFGFGKFFILWISSMAYFGWAYLYALKLTLKTKWSDFKCVLITPEHDVV